MGTKQKQAPNIKVWWLLGCIGLLLVVSFVAAASNLPIVRLMDNPYGAIIATGVALAFAAGGWDFSCFGATALSAIVFACCLFKAEMGIGVSAMITLAVGFGLGAVNGGICKLLGNKKRWLTAVASLISGGLMYSIAVWLKDSFWENMQELPYLSNNARFRNAIIDIIGRGSFAGVLPMTFLCSVIPAILLFLLFSFTRKGGSLFSWEKDKNDTSSIVNARLFFAYCIAGALCAGAQILFIIRLGVIMFPSSWPLYFIKEEGLLAFSGWGVRFFPLLAALSIAGIGIPNLRKGKGNAFAGLVSVMVATWGIALINNVVVNVDYIRSDYLDYINLAIFVVFVILNLIIRSRAIKWAKEHPIEEIEEGTAMNTGSQMGDRSKVVAALLAFFVGATGAHRYYLGYKKQGGIQTSGFICAIIGGALYPSSMMSESPATLLFAGLLLLYGGITSIWAFIDFIRILTGGLSPADGSAYTENRPPQVQVVQDASSEPTANDHIEAIEKLAKLRDQGILTEEEFQQKKADLLAKM